jgi:hypothetical protein
MAFRETAFPAGRLGEGAEGGDEKGVAEGVGAGRWRDGGSMGVGTKSTGSGLNGGKKGGKSAKRKRASGGGGLVRLKVKKKPQQQNMR